jgi:hypothetical protein
VADDVQTVLGLLMRIFNQSRLKTFSAALLTVLLLVGGLVFGVLTGGMLNKSLPMHVPQATRNLFSALPVLGILGCAGAAWGRAMGRIAGVDNPRRMAWAGGLSYGPSIIIVAIGLSLLEVQLIEQGKGPDIPIHRIYTLLFVPGTFIVAAAGALGLGLASTKFQRAFQCALITGLTAALTFLAVNLIMDSLGWRIGAPRAAERATMLTVTLVGCLGAALTGGAVTSAFLGKDPEALPVESREV